MSGNLSAKPISEQEYQEVIAEQQKQPVRVLVSLGTRRTWWMFQGKFYWEDDGLQAFEIEALVLEREAKQRRKVERAIAFVRQQELPPRTRREPIPDDVKMFVWQRDGGSCVKCGSQERLEFDHVIPVAKGGSNSARNIQLLCEVCNRAKSDSIV